MDLHGALTLIGSTPVVVLSGVVDLGTVPVLRDVLARAIDRHPGSSVTVDLDGVMALDDTGIGVLLGAAGRAREAGGDLTIVTSSEAILAKLALTGADRAIDVRARVA
jgi:anti-sigma B factor antagonist